MRECERAFVDRLGHRLQESLPTAFETLSNELAIFLKAHHLAATCVGLDALRRFTLHLICERKAQIGDAECRIKLERPLRTLDRFVVMPRQEQAETVDPVSDHRQGIDRERLFELSFTLAKAS